MGRKKIRIEKIADARNRQVTFNKRKNGLIKKAMELSMLCDAKVALVVYGANGKVFRYADESFEEVYEEAKTLQAEEVKLDADFDDAPPDDEGDGDADDKGGKGKARAGNKGKGTKK